MSYFKAKMHQIWLFTMTLLQSSDEEYGVFTYETANIKGKVEWKFSKSHKGQILAVYRAWVSVVRKSFKFYCKGTSVHDTTSFKPFCVKIGWEMWPPGRLGEKIKKVTSVVYFTYLPRSLCESDHQQIWFGGRFPGRNQLCQIVL